MAAVQWVGQNKMGTMESLERRAISELFKKFPDDAAPYLDSALNCTDRWTRRNAIALYGEMKYKPGTALLSTKLSDESYSTLFAGILSTLGDIEDTSSTPSIIPFASSSRERERIAAVTALGKLKDPRGYDAIFGAIMDSVYSVRSAAIYSIAAQEKRVLLRLEQEFSLREIERLEGLLIACGALAERWNADEKLRGDVKLLAPTVKRYLEHPDPRVQGAAIVATARVMDQKAYKKMESRFSKSESPIIRARWLEAMRYFDH